MTNLLIVGANGLIAQVATQLFSGETDAKRTLCLRRSNRLKGRWPEDRVQIM